MTPTSTLKGKVCLVTGATNGIGLEAARELGRMGATVVLCGRDGKRGQAAMSEIKRTCPDAKLEYLQADLSSLAEVRRLAQEFRGRHSRLDVLLNNAGAVVDSRRLTVDGHELTLALNHLSHFLLTHLLLDLLKASGPARIINVSSGAHQMAKLDVDDLHFERTKYTPLLAYGNSKLANILFTRSLARRLAGTQVTANSLHPGAVATGFGADYQGWFGWVVKLVRPFMLTSADGARTSVYLASSPDVAGVSGKYFYKCREARVSKAGKDDALAERLWEASVKLTGVGGDAQAASAASA
jgi:retinol dehydrogenase 12